MPCSQSAAGTAAALKHASRTARKEHFKFIPHERQAILFKVLSSQNFYSKAIQTVARLGSAPEAEYQMQIQARQPCAAAAAGSRHSALTRFLSLLHAVHRGFYSQHAGAADALFREKTCISIIVCVFQARDST